MQYIDEDGKCVTTYTPNERQGGLIWGIRQAARDIAASRDAIVRLFLRDFMAQFRQRLFGYLWALLAPLLGIASFIFLYFIGVLNPGTEEIPYPIYALLGSSIWACLVGTLGSVSAGLQSQADLIMRTNIPKLALAISSLASIIYGVLVGMVTIGLLFLIYGKMPTVWFFAYPLLVLPMLLLGTAAGLVLSVIGVIAKDATPVVTQVLSLLMYATPIIYVTKNITSPLTRQLMALNPLTYLVDVPRSLLCLGTADHVDVYLWVSLGTIALSVVALRVFYLIQDLVAERL